MGKIRKKLMFPYAGNPLEFESWLSEQAAKGLLFRGTKGLHFLFEETIPYQMEYRVVKVTSYTKEIAPFLEKGWSIVCENSDTIILAAPTLSNAEEQCIYENQSKSLMKHGKRDALLYIGFVVLCLLHFITYFDFDCAHMIDLVLLYKNIYFSAFYVLLLILGTIIAVARIFKGNRKRKQLSIDKTKHHVPWKTFYQCAKVKRVALIIVVVSLLVVSPFETVFQLKDIFGGGVVPADAPIVPAEALIPEQDPLDVYYDKSSGGSGLIKHNYYYTIYINQYQIDDEGDEDSGFYITEDYYELKKEWNMEDFLYSVVASNDLLDSLDYDVVKKEFDGFDHVLFLQMDYGVTYGMVASIGNKVMYIDGIGGIEPSQVLVEIRKALS